MQLQLQPGTVQATTGADGQVIELPSLPANLLVGRLGEDIGHLATRILHVGYVGLVVERPIQRTALACL